MKKICTAMGYILFTLSLSVNLFYCFVAGGSSVKYIVCAGAMSLLIPVIICGEYYFLLKYTK